jgi:uncharacterized heparinase superfamily protein
VVGLGTYWHTLRHLKPIQIYGRARFRLTRPDVDLRQAPPMRSTPAVRLVRPAARKQSVMGPHRLRFLNATRDLDTGGWDDPDVDRLWRYNLHYFDDLTAVDASSRSEWHRELMLRWVRENPAPRGTGWEPYPTSLRIVNWVKWSLLGNQLPDQCTQSLAVQARWLAGRLETHLLGNHLLSNGKALVFVGLFFSGAEAEEWLAQGLEILERQIPEQVLADGGQFERSTMYHALALEDLLDLCNISVAFADASPELARAIPVWRERIDPMRRWLVAMCHPDGEIGFFNDAAMGIAAPPAELEEYAARLGFGNPRRAVEVVTALHASGYIRLQRRDAVAILDVGPVGPDYLPGHAHADTLSFELSLFGERVLVNSGTSLYEGGPERARQRGTATHNTVIVDGKDSSEVWGAFRVARRARPFGLEIRREAANSVRCSHDGYRRLPGKPEHSRQWSLGENTLVIEDHVSGKFGTAEARFHLHPSVIADEVSPGANGRPQVTLRLTRGREIQVSVTGGTLRKEPATWHPEFGRTEANSRLVVSFDGASTRTQFTWSAA